MYVAAAICMLLLRAWKIGQIEMMSKPEGKSESGVGAMAGISDDGSRHFEASQTGSTFGRLFAWKKV